MLGIPCLRVGSEKIKNKGWICRENENYTMYILKTISKCTMNISDPLSKIQTKNNFDVSY